MPTIYRDAFTHICRGTHHLQNGFFAHIATIVYSCLIDVNKDGWFAAFLHSLDDDRRAQFAIQMERVLRRAPEEQKAQIWTKWMRIYWDDRVNGRPCELLPKEAEEMLEWAFVVGDAFPGAVDLILRGPKITGQFGTVCYILQKHEAPEKHPEVVLRLLDWLLQDRTTQYRISNDIEKVIFRLPKSLFEKELSS